MDEAKHSLDSAYALKTPEDSVRFYRDWAGDYDREFAEGHGYAAPRRIAQAFRRLAGPADMPVLDIGAGTGLVGEDLVPGFGGAVDGIDISAEMLEMARGKGLYRDLIEADLTRPLDLPDGRYGGLVSSGTFTHGHVGPEVLPELLRICRPGALCVFGIKREAFDDFRFGSAFAALVAERRITPLDFELFRIYDRDDHERGRDIGLTVVFRTAG